MQKPNRTMLTLIRPLPEPHTGKERGNGKRDIVFGHRVELAGRVL